MGTDAFGFVLLPSEERFRVASFRGREGVSLEYRFDVRVLTRRVLPFGERSLLGRRAALEFGDGTGARQRVHGVVTAQELEGSAWPRDGARAGDDAHDGRIVRVRIEPRFALLRLRRRSRIFQDLTVVEVVRAVLGEGGVRVEERLERSYARLEYCVQYAESDHAFVRRILAEHGIFTWYAQPADPTPDVGDDGATGGTLAGMIGAEVDDDGGDDRAGGADFETLVLADAARSYPALALDAYDADGGQDGGGPAPELRFHQGGEGGGDAAADVLRFAYREQARSTAARLTAFDFTQPQARLEAEVDVDAADAYGATPRLLADELSVHEHHDEYLRGAASRRDVRVLLERERADAARGRGECVRAALRAGHRFALGGHPEADVNREYVVRAVHHRGETPELAAPGREPVRTYEARFACAPADVPLRPASSGRAHQQSLESAMVVGPPGEEIYTDALGRVRVRFHWDREGAPDERATCWLRVAQAWAGAGFGAQWIPRIGMEVLVAFLEGDTDRPVVVGTLYNGGTPLPFDLPGDKTRSGVRTRSSPGGGGSNELSFEDAHGREQVFLRAERDLDVQVEHDLRTRVRHDEQRVVSGARATSVEGTDSLRVGADQSTLVEKSSRLVVLSNRGEEVHGNRSVRVEHDASVRVGGHAKGVVDLDARADVAGAATLTVGHVGAASPAELRVWGVLRADASKKMYLHSDEGIVLRCGESVIELGAEEIRIASKNVTVVAKEHLNLKSDGPELRLSDKAELQADEVSLLTSGAKVKLTSDVDIQGAQVKLGSGSGASSSASDSSDDDPPQVEVVVLDGAHAPLANRKFELTVAGTKYEGTTDGDGVVRQALPADAELGTLVVWLDDPPGTRVMQWSVRLRDEALPGADTLKGAQERMRHLGVYHGALHGRLDGMTRDALQRFQRRYALEVTGRLDDATSGKLGEVHGE